MSGDNGYGNENILVGTDAIGQYIGKSKRVAIEFIAMGMPARKLNGTWFAHKENIDAWFKKVTRHKNTADVVE